MNQLQLEMNVTLAVFKECVVKSSTMAMVGRAVEGESVLAETRMPSGVSIILEVVEWSTL